MGRYAGELLGLWLPQSDKRLLTFVENDGCFVDGISTATGCQVGRRTLRVLDHGKTAATFVDTQTERAVRLWPHPMARQRALDYAPAADSRWQAQLAAYQIMPVAELLCAQPVALTVSLERLLSRHGLRVTCAVCGEEIINQREVLIDGRPICRGCAGEGYCRPMDQASPLAGVVPRGGGVAAATPR
jgi:formylmethanofuran dehydrogenase subunit E